MLMEYLEAKTGNFIDLVSENMFHHMNHLPDLDDFFCTDPLTKDFGQLPSERSNRTAILDYIPFEESKFCQDALKHFGWIDAAVLKFTPNTMIDWHIDDKRRCALNFLLNDSDNCFTFIRKNIDRWNFNVAEINYIRRRPILIDTTNEHTHINYNNSHTRFVLSVSFGNKPDKASYQEVKEWLLKYNCTTYM